MLLDISVYIFEAVLLYIYAESISFSSKKRIKKIFSIAILLFCLLVLYEFGNTIFNLFFMFIFYNIIFYVVFETQLRSALFHTALFVSIKSVSEIIVMNLCSLIFNDYDATDKDITAYVFVIILSRLFYASIILAIKKKSMLKSQTEEKDDFYWVLFLFIIISVIMNFLFFYISGKIEISESLSLFISVVFILLLFTNLIIFIFYERTVSIKKKFYELKTISFQQEIDEKYFAAIEQSQEDIKCFVHDVKNHLLQIRYMESVEDIHKYLDDIIKEVEKIAYIEISSNRMLNLIISKYSAICERKQICFKFDINSTNLQYVYDIDLSTILNNLLDNAVESSEESSNKQIELLIFSKNCNFDCIIIRNFCDNPPVFIDNKLISSKKEKNMHGVGINIVKKTLKKYGAFYDWNYDNVNNIFETSIVFPKAQ